jgi:ribosome-associated toxin RatA of RatAB toxin-antitoxin module
MIRAEYSFTLPVSPDQAFAIVSDPPRHSEWMTACLHTKLLDGLPAPGRRYEITFEFLQRTMDFLVEIDTYDPWRHSRFTSIEGPFRYIADYRFHPLADGSTEVHWTFDVHPGDFFGLTPDSLIRKFLVSQVEKDSQTLRERLVESSNAAASRT